MGRPSIDPAPRIAPIPTTGKLVRDRLSWRDFFADRSVPSRLV
jgi:hypothetical protein